MKHFLMAALMTLQAGVASAATPQVIGGQAVNRADFPDVVQLVVANGQGLCSGTVVGPQVLLTAGHCAASGETIQVRLASGKTTTAICTLSPDAGDVEAQAHDVALCILAEAQRLTRYGSIDETAVKRGDVVTVAGFGCTKDNETGGNDGVLRAGDAAVSHAVGNGDADPFDFQTTSNTVVCPGDSGGPDFRQLNGQKHLIVGLNSKVSVVQQNPLKFGHDSFLTAMSTQASKDFLLTFANQNDVQICGVNATCP